MRAGLITSDGRPILRAGIPYFAPSSAEETSAPRRYAETTAWAREWALSLPIAAETGRSTIFAEMERRGDRSVRETLGSERQQFNLPIRQLSGSALVGGAWSA